MLPTPTPMTTAAGSTVWRWILLGVALLGSCGLVACDLGLKDYGLPFDERVYHAAAQRHVQWLASISEPGAFADKTLQEHFAWNPKVVVHPTFSRWLSGLSWAFYHRGFGVDELVAFRLHNALVYGLTAVAVVWFVMNKFGMPTAVVALILFWCNIRFFGHAHTAMPDLVLSGCWLGATLLCIQAVDGKSRAGLWLAAVLAGAALSTKLTGAMLVAILALWPIWVGGRAGWRQTLVLLAVPPVVFLFLNPQAWHHPIGWSIGFIEQFRIREANVMVPTMFLGVKYGHRVPVYVPLVHALITTPPALLFFSTIAAVQMCWSLSRSGRDALLARLRSPWTLCLVSGLSTLAVCSLPSVPSHDLERLFLPLQPFLVLFAAYGFRTASETGWFKRPLRFFAGRRQWIVAAALIVLLILPAIYQALAAHPYQLTYFNMFVGGSKGAQQRGFDVAYLKLEANQRTLDILNRRLGPQDRLFANFLLMDLVAYQLEGRLRADIRLVPRLPADFMLIHVRRSWMNAVEEDMFLRRPPPVWSLQHDGADLLLLYRVDFDEK